MPETLLNVLCYLCFICGWGAFFLGLLKYRAEAAEHARDWQRSDKVVDGYERQVRVLRQQLADMVVRHTETCNERDELKDILAKVETCSYDLDGILFGEDEPQTETDIEAIWEDDQGNDTE